MRKVMADLTEEVIALREEVRELRARLNQNSSNSSKPPSSDPLWKRRPPKPPTSNRPGGQPGHPGHFRKRLPPEQVDHVVPHAPTHCEKCCAPLPATPQADDPPPRWHQVAELPERLVKITEHQAQGRHCPGCGHLTWASLPPEVAGHVLGPRLAAVLAYLTARLHVTRRGIEEWAEEVLGLPLALGTVSAYEAEMSAALEPAYRETVAAVQEAPAKNVDETGWKNSGVLIWLWVAATATAAVFRLHPDRGRRGLRAHLGCELKGVLTSDRWHAYTHLALSSWQVCWAHLQRDFQGWVDRGGEGTALGQAGLAAARDLFTLWHAFRSGKMTRSELQAGLEPLKERLRQALTEARAGPERKAARFSTRLLKIYPALWNFALCEGVEPTNNHAERMLRPGVIWRKISLGSQGAEGCRFVERMLTVVQTLRLQKRNVLDYLAQVLTNHRHGLPCPHLVPAT
jgi:transposase